MCSGGLGRPGGSIGYASLISNRFGIEKIAEPRRPCGGESPRCALQSARQARTAGGPDHRPAFSLPRHELMQWWNRSKAEQLGLAAVISFRPPTTPFLHELPGLVELGTSGAHEPVATIPVNHDVLASAPDVFGGCHDNNIVSPKHGGRRLQKVTPPIHDTTLGKRYCIAVDGVLAPKNFRIFLCPWRNEGGLPGSSLRLK